MGKDNMFRMTGALGLAAAAALLMAGCSASAPEPTPTAAPLSLDDTCKEVSLLVTDIVNADGGLDYDAITEEEWAAEIDAAKAKAVALGDMDHAEASAEITALVAAVQAIPGTPSGPYPASEATGEAQYPLTTLCSENGTEITVQAKYGG